MRLLKKLVVALFLLQFSISGCSTSKDKLYKQLSAKDPENMKYQGHYKVGAKYNIKGKTYSPQKYLKYDQVGIASWYGSRHGFHGKKTANGDKYNKHILSAAHPTLPLPCLARVTRLDTGQSLIVMINDRGPFAKNRILDLSERAASVLNFKAQGLAKVRVQYLPKETQDFLKDIALAPKEGAKVNKSKNTKCSINCHVELVNLKYKLAVTR